MKRIFPIVIAIILCSCQQGGPYTEAFTANGTIRLEQKGEALCTYDPASYQLAFNREKGEFRVHTDNMSDYFILDLDQIPGEAGQQVTGTIIWTTETDIYTKREITLETAKLEGDKIWLWNTKDRIGMVVKVLE